MSYNNNTPIVEHIITTYKLIYRLSNLTARSQDTRGI